MNAKTRYDDLILKIEDGALDRDTSANDLMFSVARASAFTVGELSSMLRFMTGDTLLQYIKMRKLMAAYRFLIDADVRKITSTNAISNAVAISGYDNQNSFTKKFSAFFGLSPKEAFLKKDYSLLSEPLTWDSISCDTNHSKTNEKEVSQMASTMKFGILQEQYDKAIEAYELETLYGLPPMFSKIAFDLAERQSVSLKDAFAFADSLYDYGGDFSKEGLDPEIADMYSDDPEENIKAIAFDPYIQFMFFQCKLSVSSAYELSMFRLPISEEEAMKMDPRMLHEFARAENIEFYFFKSAYEYYEKHADDDYSDEDFDKYIDLLYRDIPKEIAFEEIIPAKFFEPDPKDFLIPNDIPDEYDSIERMAAEDECWNNVRIDVEFDEENSAYEFEDICDHGALDF